MLMMVVVDVVVLVGGCVRVCDCCVCVVVVVVVIVRVPPFVDQVMRVVPGRLCMEVVLFS